MLLVVPNSFNTLLLQWQNLEGDEFSIERSTSPKDGFEILKANYVLPFFVDDKVNLHDNSIRYYYRIKGFVGGVKVSETEGETPRYNKRDLQANKIIHEFNVVLRVMNNPPVKILLRRREGKRCPECWNPITNKIRFAGCKKCNGTGILEGYHKPIETKISRDFSQLIDYTSMLDGEKVNKTGVNAWIINTPLVSPGDIIVDVMNQRFLIERVSQRTRSQYIIRQVIDMTPLEKGHPAYFVDVEWEGY